MHLNRDKTYACCSSAECRGVARRELASAGVQVKDTAKDLGVDLSWGRRRQGTRKERQRKAARHAQRIAGLPAGHDFRLHAAGAVVVTGGAYGAEVDGIAPSVAKALRTKVHRAVYPTAAARRCVEADLVFTGASHRLDPEEYSLRATVSAWVRNYARTPHKELAQTAWEKVSELATIRPTGPVSATVHALRRLGWQADGPLSWYDHDARPVPMHDKHCLQQAVSEAHKLRNWERVAGRREDFQGAEQGVDESATLALLRKLRKKKQHKKAGTLAVALAGGTWPNARRHDAGLRQDAVCPRCGHRHEDAMHVWWHCPALDEERRQAGVLELAQEARAAAGPRCLWQCGILPAGHTTVTPSRWRDAPDEAAPRAPDGAGNSDGAWGRSLDVFTDGSAINPRHPAIRRAGWGVFIPETGVEISQPLRGAVQTSVRAEIRAAVEGLEVTHGPITIWTDCKAVLRGFHRLSDNPAKRHHGDLWERAQKAAAGREIGVKWIKSHQKEQEAVMRGWTSAQWAGNQAVDALAGAGAGQHAVSDGEVRAYLQAAEKTGKIQQWLIRVLGKTMQDRPPKPRLPPGADWRRARRKRPTRARRTREYPSPCGDHLEIDLVHGVWKCRSCGRQRSTTNKWSTWRKVPCTPLKKRKFPLDGEVEGATVRADGATPHLFDTAFGVTVCKRCGRCMQSRWRNKMGTHCAPPPPPPPPVAGEEEREGGEGGEAPTQPEPRQPAKRRRSKQEIQQMLDTHELVEAEGRVTCQRCGRSRNKARRASLGPCPAQGLAGS